MSCCFFVRIILIKKKNCRYSEKILQLHYAPQVFAYSMYRTRHKTQENNLHLPTHCRRCLNPLYPEEQKLYTTILFECTSQMSGDISLNMLRTESREVLFSIGCFGLWPCVYARAVCDKCIVSIEKFKKSLWPALDPALLVLLPAFLPCGADVIRIIGMYAFHREITYAVV